MADAPLTKTISMASKEKHLEFVQSAINRMASNSFLLKAWSVTLVGALLGGVIGAVVQYWMPTDFAWHFVYFAAGICAVLAFVGGMRFLDWLNRFFDRVW